MKKPSVLIVDDEPNIRDVFREFLEEEGYQVLIARNGQEALSTMELNRPDLVFLDIQMPGMNGVEVLRSIKETYPETKVVMISGYATVETARKTLKMGAFDYVVKPVDLRHLEEIVSLLEALHEGQKG